jgi:hypothetical protein
MQEYRTGGQQNRFLNFIAPLKQGFIVRADEKLNAFRLSSSVGLTSANYLRSAIRKFRLASAQAC